MLFQRFDSQELIFGVMPIVIQLRKALGSPVLMAPWYRPKNQWLNNTSHHKQEKITFLCQLQFFFQPWHKVSQDGCIRGHMVYPIERALEH